MGTREGLGRMGSERPLKPKQEGEVRGGRRDYRRQ